MEKRQVTLGGNPFDLTGTLIQAGDEAPEFTLLDNDLGEVKLSDSAGKVRIVACVPSLDTHVCELETKRFNEEAKKLGDGVAVMVVSVDLPFAQKRWAAEHKVDAIQLLSDHREASFGLAYGMLIPPLRLLARAVFVIDGDGKVAYVQVVPEIGEEPDYDAVLAAAKELL